MVKTQLSAFIRIQNGLGTLYKCSHKHQLCKFVKIIKKIILLLPNVFYTLTIERTSYLCQEINPHLKLTVFPQIIFQALSPLFVFADQHFQHR